MLFFYIRHGEPIYDPDSLTPLGHLQAQALAKRLARFGIDEIYASTSTRAQQTALPTAQLLNKEIIPMDWCNEGYAWDELSFKEDENDQVSWPFQKQEYRRLFVSAEVRSMGKNWINHPKLSRFEKGIKRISDETNAFFAKLGYVRDADNGCYYYDGKEDNRRIALFAHQGLGLAFLSCVLDIPYPEFCTRFDVCHSSLTVIEFQANKGIVVPRVLELSNDSHIYAEGLPTKYNNRVNF